jgi:rRNA-processing protein FCF1
MISPTYVIDTQALVWLIKGSVRKLGLNSFVTLIHPRARVVVPSYVLEEINQKFARPRIDMSSEIKVPPTALLRLLHRCVNVRILPRGAESLAKEFKLRNYVQRKLIAAQDVPIAAAALVVRDYCPDPVVLITRDRELRRWANTVGVEILSDRESAFRLLPN